MTTRKRDSNPWRNETSSTPATKRGVLEKSVVKAVEQWLTLNRIIHWHISLSALTRIRDGQATFLPNPMKGWSDFACLHRSRFIALEIKRPVGGRQSDDQKIFEAKVLTGGGEYYLVTDVGQLEGIFK